MTNRSHRAALGAGVLAALLVAACGSDDDASDTSDAPATTEAAADDEPAEAPDETDDTGVDSGVESGENADLADSITLVTYESFPTEGTPINDRLADFSAATGIDVEILVAGDTGTMLSKAELTAGNPEGDVMWGIDNTFLSRAVDSGIFEPYLAQGLESVAAEFTELVPDGEATPVDFGDVCLNYDIAALDAAGLAPPEGFADLVEPEYESRLVVQNPATSSPGLAFMLATIDEYGPDGWTGYWEQLVENDVAVTDGWTAAYYEQFSYYGGDRPIVVSYGSSPPVEILFAEEPLETAPTGVVESTCFRQVEFAGVLAGTDKVTEARLLVDHLVSTEFQAELPLNVFVFPVNDQVELDPVFVDFAVIPETSRSLDPADITANRSEWIDTWTDIVIG